MTIDPTVSNMADTAAPAKFDSSSYTLANGAGQAVSEQVLNDFIGSNQTGPPNGSGRHLKIQELYALSRDFVGKPHRIIACSEPVNGARYLNKLFEAANETLEDEGLFVGFVETLKRRREQLEARRPKWLGPIRRLLDFLVHRVIAKLTLTRGFYYQLSKGRDRALTTAEALGRLASCGFTVERLEEHDGFLHWVARKNGAPTYDEDPTYGLFIRLRRVGQGGKPIDVYKLRTMHPYAEYLQGFVFEQTGLKRTGKFKDDFRVSPWGKFLRKYWIDELPMLINWIKRDLKLVGVRPLSRHYASLYDAQFMDRRTQYKPGLIPPFYVHLPETLDGVIESETTYLDEFDRHPILTDLRYLVKAIYNIVVRKARSS